MSSTPLAAVPVMRVRPEVLGRAGLTVATFGWAAAFIIGKVVLADLSPLSTAAWRYAFAAALLMPFAWRHRARASDVAEVAVPLGIMVACGGVLYPWLFLDALQRTSATNTALLIALNPVMTILLAPIIGERLSASRLGGVLLAMIGAAVVITRGHLGVVGDQAVNAGDLLAVAAAALWALFNLASRRVAARLPASLTNFAVYGGGGLILFLLAAPEHPVMQLAGAKLSVAAGVVVMAVLSSVLAGQCFLFGVRVLGVSRTVVFVYFVPVLTALLSATFLGERFETAQAVGGAAVLIGVYFCSRSRSAR